MARAPLSSGVKRSWMVFDERKNRNMLSRRRVAQTLKMSMRPDPVHRILGQPNSAVVLYYDFPAFSGTHRGITVGWHCVEVGCCARARH